VRRLFFALVPLLFAGDAGAQIIRPGMRFGEPAAWVSLGVALQNGFDVHDGSTGSTWQFGDATQFVASIEKPVTSGVTFGVRGTHARVPLLYVGRVASTDADANVSQVMALLHVSSGREFHSVLELGAGATIFSNFRARGSDIRLEPLSPDTDFAFAFGYGFGYSFSPTVAVDVMVQDLSTALHQKSGLNAGESTSNRMTSTRIVARFGLGGR
jgi:hypothetical protein